MSHTFHTIQKRKRSLFASLILLLAGLLVLSYTQFYSSQDSSSLIDQPSLSFLSLAPFVFPFFPPPASPSATVATESASDALNAPLSDINGLPSTATTIEPDMSNNSLHPFIPTVMAANTPTVQPARLALSVDERIAQMTLEEKVGQLFLVSFAGPNLSPALMTSSLHIDSSIVVRLNK